MLIIDQITKKMAIQKLSFLNPKVIIPNYLKLEITKNYGAAFGIMKNQQWLFIIVALIAIFVFFLLSARPTKQLLILYLGYGFLLGGAIGNLVDRFRMDFVIDFIHLKGFPIFNIADLSIDIGLIILFWYLLIGEKSKKHNKENVCTECS
jgi:signal peptidase II